MRQLLVPFIAGGLFAIGLVFGGMTQPRKVIGFLDFGGAWDPSLMFVMVGAIGVYLPVHRWILARGRPLFAAEHSLPKNAIIDRSLIAGAVLFGIGWGLAGVCPGPAIVSLAGAAPHALVFFVTMLAGMRAHTLYDQARDRGGVIASASVQQASNHAKRTPRASS